MGLTPAQVHAQQHIGPVLGLGPAGAGLDIEIGIVSIHLAGKHALEFQARQQGFLFIQVIDNRVQGGLIIFLDREVDQIDGIMQGLFKMGQGFDHVLQLGTLSAEFLGTFRIIPDLGVFQFAADFV